MFENWRFNPFTGTMNSVSITDEEHTVEYHADWCAYGIQLDEAPELENPSSVSIVEDVTGQPAFTEVPRTQAPSAGEFRVDYDALTYYGTGRIEFNAADVGKAVLVSYKGTGWTVKNNYRQSQLTVPTNMEVEEDVTIHGDLDLDGETTGGGDLHVAGDVDVDGALDVAGGITGDVTGDLTGDADRADGINETGSGAGVMHFKIIEIGDWDMDSDVTKVVSTGVSMAKIKMVTVHIIDDPGGQVYNLLEGGSYRNTGPLLLSRTLSGFFDSVLFEATSYNRGWVTIGYID